MKVENLKNKQGKAVSNQFIITDGNKVAFQSYESLICEIENGVITFTKSYNFSPTTAKHRNAFLSNYFGNTVENIDVQHMIEKEYFQGYKVYLLN